MGKGCAPRPYSVPKEQFSNSWDAIFGKKNKEENKEVPKDEEAQPENPDAK